MSLSVNSNSVQRIKHIVAIALLIVLAACGKEPSAGSADMTAAPPQADAAMVAEAVANAASASAATNPLCEKATYAEVSAVTGANFDKIDVIEGPDMDYLDCVFLDSKDLFAGLVIRFVSNEKLVATSSKWQNASAYFEEWSRGGDSVAGIGESAAWTSLPSGLMVLNGDQVLQFSASKSDTSDPAVRAKFETLARMVIARLP